MCPTTNKQKKKKIEDFRREKQGPDGSRDWPSKGSSDNGLINLLRAHLEGHRREPDEMHNFCNIIAVLIANLKVKF